MPAAQVKIEFSHKDFVASHGKEPRGRGSWAFEVFVTGDSCPEGEVFKMPDDTLLGLVWSTGGSTLAEARRECGRKAIAAVQASPLSGLVNSILLTTQP